jgi:hypothetical protein
VQRSSQHNRLSASTKRCTDFVPPALEKAAAPAANAAAVFRPWPPSVIVVAVTGTVNAVTNGPGHLLLATLGSLAHVTLACSDDIAIALRDTSRYARQSRYPLHRCRSRPWSRASRDPKVPEVASSFQNVPRPKLPSLRRASGPGLFHVTAVLASWPLPLATLESLARECPLARLNLWLLCFASSA